MNAKQCIQIFDSCIEDYHKNDDVDTKMHNPFGEGSIDELLYLKSWIDTVQWHLEDIIRDPEINPTNALEIKRRIDHSNQLRTDVVEKVDDYYIELYKETTPNKQAVLNTESPGWVIDRLSILSLKIYHMKEQVNREDVNQAHLDKCNSKLTILLEQQSDLTTSFNHLLKEIESGLKKIKVYRQMKMYNDNTLNPVLYKKNNT